jgi:multidrug efflux pump
VLGVPMQTIDDTLYDAFGQRQISTIFTELNQYRVVLEVAPEFRTSTALMEQLAVASNGAGALTGTNATSFGQVTSSNSSTATGIGAQNTGITVGAGNIIPLSALAEGKVSSAPLVVSHQQQLPAVTVSFNVAPGYSLSEAVRAIQETKDSLDMPTHLHAEFIGKAAEFTGSQTDVVWLLLASLVVIYIVLGVLYESYIHPITIISTLPPAGVGALLALMLCGLSLSVDRHRRHRAADRHRQEERHHDGRLRDRGRRAGANAHEAIRRACLLRFRPIMMTTAAAMLGALPLALGTGIGSNCAARWASPSSAACCCRSWSRCTPRR